MNHRHSTRHNTSLSSSMTRLEPGLTCVSRQRDPRFRTGCPLSIALRASASSRGGTNRSNGRASRGLPVACYESCQSPECNRYQGPEVGIEPIRSAPPRACRRPGRFIMLISPRQNSTRAPRAFRSNRLCPHPASLVAIPFFISPYCRYVVSAKREKAARWDLEENWVT